jgi:hypothetical protein
MPRNLSVGPTGTNRVSLAAQYLVRYWPRECGRRVRGFVPRIILRRRLGSPLRVSPQVMSLASK